MKVHLKSGIEDDFFPIWWPNENYHSAANVNQETATESVQKQEEKPTRSKNARHPQLNHFARLSCDIRASNFVGGLLVKVAKQLCHRFFFLKHHTSNEVCSGVKSKELNHTFT